MAPYWVMGVMELLQAERGGWRGLESEWPGGLWVEMSKQLPLARPHGPCA